MAGIANKLDKAYEDKPLEELADAPVAALQGVSDGDAEHLKVRGTGRRPVQAAFNIVSIRDLGTNKFFLLGPSDQQTRGLAGSHTSSTAPWAC